MERAVPQPRSLSTMQWVGIIAAAAVGYVLIAVVLLRLTAPASVPATHLSFGPRPTFSLAAHPSTTAAAAKPGAAAPKPAPAPAPAASAPKPSTTSAPQKPQLSKAAIAKILAAKKHG